MAASISGLASGLDTATIINQLMQLEAAPQNRLKTRISDEQLVLTSLQALNKTVASLATKAAALAKDTAWQPLTATSSNVAVSVSTTSSAAPRSLTVTVTGVAATHQLGYANGAGLSDVVTGASTKVRLDRFDGSPVELETGDGTLQGLVSAINKPENATGLTATVVKQADNSYRLLVESTKTGAAEDFDLTALDGSPLLGGATVRAGSNASISLGAGITATSATNTFVEVVPGTTITLGAAATTGTVSTITVARDTSGMSAKVKDLVDSVNAALAEIDVKAAAGGAGKTAGPLSGDGAARQLRTALLDTIRGDAGGTSLAAYGIQVTRSGRLELDEAKFKAAYAADPIGTAEMFTTTGDGFAARVAAVAQGASDSTEGTLSAAITGRQSGIDRMEDSIDEWDRRLTLRRTALERQFTALETALSQMSSQSSWLAGQLSSLPSGSGA
jgi:flagellar hook-associated protein 2